MNLSPEATHTEIGSDLLHTVIIGGGPESLSWVPRLFRDPQINLLGVVSTHPEDMILNLDRMGYALTDPCPLSVYPDIAALVELPHINLMIDTTADPGIIRHLAESGLEEIPRVNGPALELVLARPPAAPHPTDTTGFPERLAREVGRAYRHGRPVGVIRVRIDAPDGPLSTGTIKTVNDVIEQSLRLEDVIESQRDGSFTVLLPETGNATHHVANRLTSHLANLKIRTEGGGAAQLHESVGWAWFPQDAKTAQALLDQADARMGVPSPPEE
ncbi:MAG: GGDEF domain-containing protein [Leptospirillia bacterium]